MENPTQCSVLLCTEIQRYVNSANEGMLPLPLRAAASATSVPYCSTISRFPELFLRAVEGCCRERQIENLKLGKLESRKDQGRHSTEVLRGGVQQGSSSNGSRVQDMQLLNARKVLNKSITEKLKCSRWSHLNHSCSSQLTFGPDLIALAKPGFQIKPGGGHGWVHRPTR